MRWRPSTSAGWPSGSSYRPEIALGRALAACTHPLAAWRILSIPWQVMMLTAYAAASYLVVLVALLVLI